ncbi:MAG: hypothetical protein K2K33_06290, partial [Muribaculaceae bacterium]|nr:hypothetical protein [Muribaculaceae bacterium]
LHKAIRRQRQRCIRESIHYPLEDMDGFDLLFPGLAGYLHSLLYRFLRFNSETIEIHNSYRKYQSTA